MGKILTRPQITKLMIALAITVIDVVLGLYAFDKLPMGATIADPTSGSLCSDEGVIIVMFKDAASDKRQTDIIASENLTIARKYESLNGYAINVPAGQEQKIIDKLLKYSEVNTANVSTCYTTQ